MHLDLELNQPIGTCLEQLDVSDEEAMDLSSFFTVLGLDGMTRSYWEFRAYLLDQERQKAKRDPASLKDWEKCSACDIQRTDAFTEMIINRMVIAELPFDEFDINRRRPEEEGTCGQCDQIRHIIPPDF
jgi:hypothetical protein